jgi:aerobic-type carbon monoxide dehydrogenase small subunit (CoxS/CutS family)
MNITLHVNGREHQLAVQPGDSLVRVLRGEGYFGIKRGCDTGECGACTILLDGRPALSCLMLAAQADGAKITTADGLGVPGNLHPLQSAFVESGAVQCGFCTPAMVLVSHALLQRSPDPTEEEIRESLSGVLCRCTGYVKPVRAVLLAASRLREAKGT